MYCPKCGSYNGDGSRYCQSCGNSLTGQQKPAVRNTSATGENMLMGIVGALIGAVVGGAVIILLSRLGVVAAASGIILSACVIMGYMKLGNDMSIPGLLICVGIILVTPYIADRLDWALLIVEAYNEYSLIEAFQAVPEFIEIGAIDEDVYWESLLKVYAFAAIGGISMIISIFKK